MYGFIDLVVMDEHRGLLGVQVTTTSNMWSREQKIRSLPEATAWLNKGLRIRIEGWSKKGARGKVKHWELTTKDITL